MSADDTVQVEPWVILYAFRYGLGRYTYAHTDALKLVRDHWPVLARWADTIVADLHHTASRCTGAAIECGMEQQCLDLVAWIDDQRVFEYGVAHDGHVTTGPGWTSVADVVTAGRPYADADHRTRGQLVRRIDGGPWEAVPSC